MICQIQKFLLLPQLETKVLLAPLATLCRGGVIDLLQASAGMGLLARLVLTVALVVAAVSCAWAWQLQQILDKVRCR
jgi:hypothetical protein